MSQAAPRHALARRVLIVDEHEVCDLLSDMVLEDGFTACCVHSDAQAHEALRAAGDFECMIVDVNLGQGTTGYDIARFARAVAPSIPVIYVSGQTSPASHRANGVTGSLFLPKPFTAADLLERLRMLLGDNDD
jgi:DNA-binding response OmpR family regulator